MQQLLLLNNNQKIQLAFYPNIGHLPRFCSVYFSFLVKRWRFVYVNSNPALFYFNIYFHYFAFWFISSVYVNLCEWFIRSIKTMCILNIGVNQSVFSLLWYTRVVQKYSWRNRSNCRTVWDPTLWKYTRLFCLKVGKISGGWWRWRRQNLLHLAYYNSPQNREHISFVQHVRYRSVEGKIWNSSYIR